MPLGSHSPLFAAARSPTAVAVAASRAPHRSRIPRVARRAPHARERAVDDVAVSASLI